MIRLLYLLGGLAAAVSGLDYHDTGLSIAFGKPTSSSNGTALTNKLPVRFQRGADILNPKKQCSGQAGNVFTRHKYIYYNDQCL